MSTREKGTHNTDSTHQEVLSTALDTLLSSPTRHTHDTAPPPSSSSLYPTQQRAATARPEVRREWGYRGPNVTPQVMRQALKTAEKLQIHDLACCTANCLVFVLGTYAEYAELIVTTARRLEGQNRPGFGAGSWRRKPREFQKFAAQLYQRHKKNEDVIPDALASNVALIPDGRLPMCLETMGRMLGVSRGFFHARLPSGPNPRHTTEATLRSSIDVIARQQAWWKHLAAQVEASYKCDQSGNTWKRLRVDPEMFVSSSSPSLDAPSSQSFTDSITPLTPATDTSAYIEKGTTEVLRAILLKLLEKGGSEMAGNVRGVLGDAELDVVLREFTKEWEKAEKGEEEPSVLGSSSSMSDVLAQFVALALRMLDAGRVKSCGKLLFHVAAVAWESIEQLEAKGHTQLSLNDASENLVLEAWKKCWPALLQTHEELLEDRVDLDAEETMQDAKDIGPVRLKRSGKVVRKSPRELYPWRFEPNE